jgi:S-formylglutathione hydrolase FrmB
VKWNQAPILPLVSQHKVHRFTRRALLATAALSAGNAILRSRRADGTAAPAVTPPATKPIADKPAPSWFNPPKTPQPLLSHRSYQSATMATRVGYNLYLPPGYDNPTANTARYPVIYWLHGRGQSESTDQFPPGIVQQAILEKRIPPAIVVYANGGANTWYADSVDGKVLAETTIIKELIPHIDATCRTIASRSGRAIQGMSMGGGGTMKLALKYPDLFSSAVGFAPSFRTAAEMDLEGPQRETFACMFGGDADRFMAEHPAAHLRKNLEQVRGRLAIKFFIGTKDKPVLLGGTRRFHALLDELKVPHEYHEIEGIEHNLPKLAQAVKYEALEFAAKHWKG